MVSVDEILDLEARSNVLSVLSKYTGILDSTGSRFFHYTTVEYIYYDTPYIFKW